MEEKDYVETMTPALTDFKNADYPDAIAKLEHIKAAYPNDESANFYTGLSYYNSEQFKEAIKYLEPLSKSKAGVFSEEAAYYTALSYYKWGKKEKGMKMLKDIAAKNGFYTNQAKEFLQSQE